MKVMVKLAFDVFTIHNLSLYVEQATILAPYDRLANNIFLFTTSTIKIVRN